MSGRRKGMSGRRGPRGMWCRRRQRAPHDVGERCTSTPHTARRRTARARIARARTAGAHNASMGSASAQNESMYSASTKHGPVHPRDVDDFDERSAHDLDERCTSTPHAQHEGAQHGNAQQGHAQHRERTVRQIGANSSSSLVRKRAPAPPTGQPLPASRSSRTEPRHAQSRSAWRAAPAVGRGRGPRL